MLCLQFDYDIDNTSPNLDSVRFGKGSVFDINFCSRFAPWFHNKGPNTWRNFFKNIKCFFHYSPRHNLATFIDCHSLLQDSRLLAICTLMVSTYSEICTILFFFICDPIPILLSKVDLQSDPILSPSWEKDLQSDTFRSFSILSDPILIMYT